MKQLPEDNNGRIPLDIFEKLKIHMGNLEASLLKADPEMPNHLRESHRLLITYPETVHLLDDDEINKLIQAQEIWVKEKIVTEAAKGKGSRGKSKISVDDL